MFEDHICIHNAKLYHLKIRKIYYWADCIILAGMYTLDTIGQLAIARTMTKEIRRALDKIYPIVIGTQAFLF